MRKILNVGLVAYGLGGQIFHAPNLHLHGRDFLGENVQRSHLRLRGLACNTTYAEGFEVFRLIIED